MGEAVLEDRIFNSEIEYAIRVIVLLGEYCRAMSLDEIFLVDFISCYPTSFEIEGEILYGMNRMLKSEISLRKEKVWNAVRMLLFKDIVGLTVSSNLGFLYSLNQSGMIIDSKLNDEYIKKYRQNVDLVYDKYSDSAEVELMNKTLEFIREE